MPGNAKKKCPQVGHLYVEVRRASRGARPPIKWAKLSTNCDLELTGGQIDNPKDSIHNSTTYQKLCPGSYSLKITPKEEEALCEIRETIQVKKKVVQAETSIGEGAKQQSVTIEADKTRMHFYRFYPYVLRVVVRDDYDCLLKNVGVEPVGNPVPTKVKDTHQGQTDSKGWVDLGCVPKGSSYELRISLPDTDKKKFKLPANNPTASAHGLKNAPFEVVLASVKPTVKFEKDRSALQEIWDLWIDEKPAESVASFSVTTDPAGFTPIQATAQVTNNADSSVVRTISATVQIDRCDVHWDGTNDKGKRVDIGSYFIRLKVKTEHNEASADSTRIKIVRVGIKSLSYTDGYDLKFAFQNYTGKKYAVRNDDIPNEFWKLKSLDDGHKPRTSPVCSITGKCSDPDTYCYPVAGYVSANPEITVTTAGQGYDNGDKIRLRIVQPDPNSDVDWSPHKESAIQIGQSIHFTADDLHKLPDHVCKVTDLHFAFYFDYQDSKNQWRKLGRQVCSQITVYVVVSAPGVPWGVAERPWIELLELACTDWGNGATTEAQAAAKITEAVNQKMSLKYDIENGDVHNNLVENPGNMPDKIHLRAFLQWLRGAWGRPADWNVLNCTCCGALVSTIANVLGCDLNSSIMRKTDWKGFFCYKILAIGYTEWHHPFHQYSSPCTCGHGPDRHSKKGKKPCQSELCQCGHLDTNHQTTGKKPCQKSGCLCTEYRKCPCTCKAYQSNDTVGKFTYHEVAWTGAAGPNDKIYDACLKAADHPDIIEATNPIFIEGKTFDPDYKQRLIDPVDRAIVLAHSVHSGNYTPV